MLNILNVSSMLLEPEIIEPALSALVRILDFQFQIMYLQRALSLKIQFKQNDYIGFRDCLYQTYIVYLHKHVQCMCALLCLDGIEEKHRQCLCFVQEIEGACIYWCTDHEQS